MADLHEDLDAIADELRGTEPLPPPSALRARSDRRVRLRTVAASTGLVALAVAGTVYYAGRWSGPAPDQPAAPASATARASIGTPASTAPKTSKGTGIAAILAGEQPTRIVMQGTGGAVLALGTDDDDRVQFTTESVPDDRALWILRPQGRKHQIVLTTPHGTSEVCMTVVHDKAPGTVRDRVCNASDPAQLFTIAKEEDGSYSIFNGKRYVQGIDGPNLLVPDLNESLTTTYKFQAG